MERPATRPKSCCSPRPPGGRWGPEAGQLELGRLVAGPASREEALARARHHLGSLGPEVAERVACALVDCMLAGELP